MTLLLVYFLLIIFRYMRRILHRFRLSKEETVSGAFAAVSRPATEEDVEAALDQLVGELPTSFRSHVRDDAAALVRLSRRLSPATPRGAH